jgi:DNA-binding MarR family transcriptional regulator
MARDNAARENTARKNAMAGLRLVAGGRSAMDDDKFNSLIHERTRLAIVSTLAVNESMTFSELKKLLDLTDGNLSIHTQKLESAGYIGCRKGFRGRVPRTDYRLTRKGRRALERYLAHMERLIQTVRDK